MGEYADAKIKKIQRALKWLATKDGVSISQGGRHNYSVKYVFADRPFPIPFNHGVVNKHIVKDLMKHLVQWGVCTKQEFDERIK